MHLALRSVSIWLTFCLVFSVALVLTTDGEPVCDGPLIYDWDGLDPPQCNTVMDGLRRMMPIIAFGSAALTWLVGATAWLIGRFRSAPA